MVAVWSFDLSRWIWAGVESGEEGVIIHLVIRKQPGGYRSAVFGLSIPKCLHSEVSVTATVRDRARATGSAPPPCHFLFLSLGGPPSDRRRASMRGTSGSSRRDSGQLSVHSFDLAHSCRKLEGGPTQRGGSGPNQFPGWKMKECGDAAGLRQAQTPHGSADAGWRGRPSGGVLLACQLL